MYWYETVLAPRTYCTRTGNGLCQIYIRRAGRGGPGDPARAGGREGWPRTERNQRTMDDGGREGRDEARATTFAELSTVLACATPSPSPSAPRGIVNHPLPWPLRSQSERGLRGRINIYRKIALKAAASRRWFRRSRERLSPPRRRRTSGCCCRRPSYPFTYCWEEEKHPPGLCRCKAAPRR